MSGHCLVFERVGVILAADLAGHYLSPINELDVVVAGGATQRDDFVHVRDLLRVHTGKVRTGRAHDECVRIPRAQRFGTSAVPVDESLAPLRVGAVRVALGPRGWGPTEAGALSLAETALDRGAHRDARCGMPSRVCNRKHGDPNKVS